VLVNRHNQLLNAPSLPLDAAMNAPAPVFAMLK
jgi:hypothetical protein